MANHTWRELSPLLDEVLELDAAARERWLYELGATSPTVERELRQLLAEDARLESNGFLSTAPLERVFGAAPSMAGHQVGAWSLERPIGQGGMGTVWLAHRGDGRFEGSAAVKLLNVSLLGRGGEERFRREGSLLARLSHPNVARLLDAGLAAGGQPFLVLEFVEGVHIDRWCDERELGVPSRLRLFRQLLEAVAHAHANLVVHRDIKPSNILVTPAGTVKLLDFGIAQLSASDETGDRTRPAFTPDYASPEQLEGSPVSTASDVYSLGVLLFLLLTGRHPTAGDEPSAAARLRAVVAGEPRRASEAVVARGDGSPDSRSAERLARLRSATPSRLGHQLAGDLDTILRKTLRKEPGERYASVAALADDIDRHLRHEPVRARPDSLGYRLRKFVRRNGAAVAAAGAVLVALTTATGVTARQLVVAREQRDLARHAAQRTEAATELQSFVLTQAGPGGTPVSMSQMLERARRLIDRRFARVPALHSAMLIDLAGRYLELDDRESERRTLREAAGLARSIRDDELLAEAECAYARNLAYSGVSDSIPLHIREARSALARVRSPGLSLRADCLVAEAEIQRWVGTPDSAVAYAQRALRMLEDSSATLNTRYGGMLNDLATYLGVAGRNREAIPVFRRILALLDSLGLDDSQQHVVVAFNLAVSLRDMGEWASARDVIASELRRGGPSGENVSTMLKYLYGTTTSALAMNDTALLWLTRAGRDTSLRSASLVAGIPAGLALVRLRQGQRAAARPLVRQALDAYRRVPDRPQSQANRVLLQARARVAEGDVRRALAGLRADLRWMGYFDGKQERYMGPILVAAAEEALALGELDAAERFARSAREVAAVDSLALRQSAVVGEASLVHARVSRAKGDTSAAGTWAELSIPALAFGYGGDHPRTVEARALLDTLRRTR